MSSSPSSGDGTSKVLHEGWLTKLGEQVKNWKRRWFKLFSDGTLTYSENADSKKPKGMININDAIIRNVTNTQEYGVPYALTLHPFEGDRVYVVYADTLTDREEWVQALAKFGDASSSVSTNVNSKAKDVLFGGGKSSGHKSYDKLGMNKPQAELFGKNPKAYHTLGASTHTIVQHNQPDTTLSNAQSTLCEGYLTKRGEKVKNWKQRWCHLTAGGILSYFASEEAAKKKNPEPKGAIDCNKAVIRLADQHDYQQNNAFTIHPAGSERIYIFVAPSLAAREEWVSSLSQVGDGPSSIVSSSANAKAKDVLFGGNKREGAKYDKLGMNQAELDMFNDKPKAFQKLGVFDASTSSSSDILSSRRRLDIYGHVIAPLHVVKFGWLGKRGGSVKTFKKRFFILTSSALTYYKTELDETPAGEISISSGALTEPQPEQDDSAHNNYCFSVTPFVPGALGKQRKYLLFAFDDSTRNDWIRDIEKAVQQASSNARAGPDFSYSTEDNRQYSGYLSKRGVHNTSFKKRYFILYSQGTKLSYFTTEADASAQGVIQGKLPLGTIPLKHATIARVSTPQQPLCFQITPEATERAYILQATSVEEYKDWVEALLKYCDVVSAEEREKLVDVEDDTEELQDILNRNASLSIHMRKQHEQALAATSSSSSPSKVDQHHSDDEDEADDIPPPPVVSEETKEEAEETPTHEQSSADQQEKDTTSSPTVVVDSSDHTTHTTTERSNTEIPPPPPEMRESIDMIPPPPNEYSIPPPPSVMYRESVDFVPPPPTNEFSMPPPPPPVLMNEFSLPPPPPHSGFLFTPPDRDPFFPPPPPS